ncbi:hypothetical protein B7486_23265 [cyanobacterium TDX16]|nr:hypothetical protein B7486_23265 [cyanobacterium TDX16]
MSFDLLIKGKTQGERDSDLMIKNFCQCVDLRDRRSTELIEEQFVEFNIPYRVNCEKEALNPSWTAQHTMEQTKGAAE